MFLQLMLNKFKELPAIEIVFIATFIILISLKSARRLKGMHWFFVFLPLILLTIVIVAQPLWRHFYPG